MPGVNQDNLPTFSRGGDLTAADLNRIVDALRQQKLVPGSFQTGSFFVQRPVGVAAETTADTTYRLARVTTEITAATSNYVDDWGSGEVVLLDDATGLPTGDPIAVTNRLDVGFVVDAQVELAGTMVRNGTCAEFVSWIDEAP